MPRLFDLRGDMMPSVAACQLPVHPALYAIAEIDDDQYVALKMNIAALGVHEPVLIAHDGQLADGRARIRAASELGLEVPVRRLAPDVDVREIVATRNIHRRHLDPTDLAFAAADDIERFEREAAATRGRRDLPPDAPRGSARDRAGHAYGVAGGLVGYALKVCRVADPDLEQQARKKIIPLAFGAQLAVKPIAERRLLLDAANDRQVRCTPRSLVARLVEIVGPIDLDPATPPNNPVGAAVHYSLENQQDGTALPWHGAIKGVQIRRVFVNPPFGTPLPWVEKAVKTVALQQEIAIWMLLPARVIGTRAGALANAKCAERLDFDERLVFETQGGAQMPGALNDGCVLWAFGAARVRGLADLGTCFVPVREDAA